MIESRSHDRTKTPSRKSANGRAAWNLFLDEVKRAASYLTRESGGHADVWYRGHAQASFPLLPKLLRGYCALDSERTRRHIHQQEQRIYREFTARLREFHGLVNEDWDNLFAMAHCGVPTRLLEWTESLAIAVYFALHRFEEAPGTPAHGVEQDPPSVWILNPYELNARVSGAVQVVMDPRQLGSENRSARYSDLLRNDRLAWEDPLAVHPVSRTTRMQLHRSWFTIHGERGAALDELQGSNGFLARVEIPLAADAHARDYLRDCGLDLLSLYRDLPHIGVHLSRANAADKLKFVKAAAM